MRDRFNIPVSDAEPPNLPFYQPPEGSRSGSTRTSAARPGGYLPKRRAKTDEVAVPDLATFQAVLDATAEGREISTSTSPTQAAAGQATETRTVPILVDEARTFGMEGLFRQIGIYNPQVRTTPRSTRTR